MLYFKNEINLINIINLNNSKIFNYLSNLLQKKFRKLKIKIKWTQNKNYKKYKYIPHLITGSTSCSKICPLYWFLNDEEEDIYNETIINEKKMEILKR